MHDYLFVYGTLRQQFTHPMAKWLSLRAQWLGSATYQGRLYQVKHYPGVVPSNNPDERVYGDVYQFPTDSVLLGELDRYEECGPVFAHPNEYVRLRQPVSLSDGQLFKAWVYIYNRDFQQLAQIKSGDFLQR